MRTRVRKGFTLVEILIVVVILGILAAIVIPQFTSASEEAQVGNVQTQLQTIRSQIELYRVRNNGQAPVIVGDAPATPADFGSDGSAFAALLADTDSFGETQRPYMRNPPVNPRNKRADVAEAEDPRDAANAPAAADGPGWYYNSSTGEFAAAGFDETENRWVTE